MSGRFRLGIGKRFFPEKAVGSWNRLPGQGSRCQAGRAQALDNALRHKERLGGCPVQGQQLSWDGPCGSLPAGDALRLRARAHGARSRRCQPHAPGARARPPEPRPERHAQARPRGARAARGGPLAPLPAPGGRARAGIGCARPGPGGAGERAAGQRRPRTWRWLRSCAAAAGGRGCRG